MCWESVIGFNERPKVREADCVKLGGKEWSGTGSFKTVKMKGIAWCRIKFEDADEYSKASIKDETGMRRAGKSKMGWLGLRRL